MEKEFKIANRYVGSGHPVYIIAEAGSNHNQKLGMAKKLIEEAAKAGADAVKFQSFRAKDHYARCTPDFSYLGEKSQGKSTYELIKSLEINRDWHETLIKHAESCGITFLSSPCDYEAVDQLAKLNMAAFKVASFDLPDLNLITHIARYKKPLILSTGMADYADIQDAINACSRAGNNEVVLLQCTSLYPAPVSLSNLRAINVMRQAFACPVGYSDHTYGDHIAIAAVVLNACMIEKHFTLDRTLPGPDHAFAIEPHELSAMIQKIRDVEAAAGDGIKNGPRQEECEMYDKGRRSIHTTLPIKAGEIITKERICIKRPGYGISPRFFETIIGMSVRQSIPEDHWISWNDLK